jgi:hypothetical protein
MYGLLRKRAERLATRRSLANKEEGRKRLRNLNRP